MFPDQPDADFQDGFALKFHAAVRLSCLFWLSLLASHGNVVMIVGGAARTPDHKFMVGGAVNAALANYSKALAGQGLIDDVNVNWVSPGQTETERLKGCSKHAHATRTKPLMKCALNVWFHEGIRRLGRPEDTARWCRSCVVTKHAISMAPGSALMVVLQKGAFDGFFTTEEQRLLVGTIREFIHRELKPLEEDVEAGGYLADDVAREIRQKSQELGLYAVNIPREFGGGGLSVLEWMMVEEQAWPHI